MAKAVKLTGTDLVTQHIQKLDAGIRPAIEYLRHLIMSTDKQIAEQIKWNNPSFYYTGEMAPFDPKEYKRDMIVMNLHKNRIMLVFPSGAKVTDPLLEGDYKDGRRLVTFVDITDIKTKEKRLKSVIKAWLKVVNE